MMTRPPPPFFSFPLLGLLEQMASFLNNADLPLKYKELLVSSYFMRRLDELKRIGFAAN